MCGRFSPTWDKKVGEPWSINKKSYKR